MTQFLGILFNAAVVLFFFSFTIFVHELGHFWVARKLGFKVLEFSIGFGPAFWKRTINGVVWKLSIIPLGGYVKLPQMDPTGASLTEDEKRNPEPVMAPWKRIAVGLAGVTCNMILAVVLAFLVSWMGRPADMRDYDTTVEDVYTNGFFYAAGVRPGDVITSVSGRDVRNWEHVVVEGALHPKADFEIQRGDKTFTVHFETNSVEAAIGTILSELSPATVPVIGDLYKGWPAHTAGLRSGDRILSIDGRPVTTVGQMRNAIMGSEGRSLLIEFERKGKRQTLSVTPRLDEGDGKYRIGNQFQGGIVHPKPMDEIIYAAGAVQRTLNKFKQWGSAKRAFNAIGGVPEIMTAFWERAKEGLISAVALAVTLNVNLAIMNLLPIPVLDGGHILLALYEWIRRKQASAKFVGALWQGSAMLLISLMLFLTLRGLYRVTIWNSRSNAAEAAAETNRAAASKNSLHSQKPVNAPP